jgi:hypothetical protein
MNEFRHDSRVPAGLRGVLIGVSSHNFREVRCAPGPLARGLQHGFRKASPFEYVPPFSDLFQIGHLPLKRGYVGGAG